MENKQVIIDDQKETIHRLQQECTEKTNAFIALGEQLKAKEQECEKYEQTLTEVRKTAQGVRNYLKYPAPKDVRYEMDIILQKISEYEVEND